MFNPVQKFGKKINRILSGGHGGSAHRFSSAGDEGSGLQPDDSQHPEGIQENSPDLNNHHADAQKGFVQQISSGVENFFKGSPDNSRSVPLRSSIPEGEEDDAPIDRVALPTYNETTPPHVLLERIEYLENCLRGETYRSQGLEAQLAELKERMNDMERIAHKSWLAQLIRACTCCCQSKPEIRSSKFVY